MKKFLEYLKEHKIVVDIGLIVLLAFILSIPNFSSKSNIYYDDGCQHLIRGYYTYQTIAKGESSKVIPDLANGFGYSWDLFYGPISEYCLILFGIIFSSFNVGFKVLLFVILALSGVFLYKFVFEMFYNRKVALLAGIIYITSPYFFTDMFTRHSLR